MKMDHNLAGYILMSIISDKDKANQLLSNFNQTKVACMSPEEALALMIEGNLSVKVYRDLRKNASCKGHHLYPSYDKVFDAKQATYPENVFISETLCAVPLQNLLNHTAKRLILALKLDVQDSMKLVFILKYGFDETNCKTYKQKANDADAFCESLFCSSLVTLKLFDENTGKVHWLIPRPSSTRFCRPIKISYEKETVDKIMTEASALQREIDDLNDLVINNVTVSFHMHLTMIDGKVVGALNKASSQKCHVCRATIRHFNKIKKLIALRTKPKALTYGFPVLHAHIRFMELVLHVSYKLDLLKKKYKVAWTFRYLMILWHWNPYVIYSSLVVDWN
ncbi:hypothetical protein TKK_0000318 [Trichogramma kaykai]|uniref:Uncharacterized protein n=1 Tax=Trichogramma kaykai TaxID=54128 RepID=A0ABD2W723_9HYME